MKPVLGLPFHPGYLAIKKINTINKHRSKIVRNRVFDYHLSPDLAIENTVSSDFLSVFIDCQERFRLPPIRCAFDLVNVSHKISC